MLSRVNVGVGHECRNTKEVLDGRSCESTESEHDRERPSVSSVDKSWIEINSQECQMLQVSAAKKIEMDVDGELQSQSPKVPPSNFSGAGIAVKDEEVTYVIPKIGMEFESEDHAYKCYSRYAVLEGFSIRKDFVSKSRINGAVVSRSYTCYRQGYRPTKHNANARKSQQETRTGCLAHMTIARQSNGSFRVTHFETKHNHEFETQNTAHMLPSQKRLTFAGTCRWIMDSRDEYTNKRLAAINDELKLYRYHTILNCARAYPKGLNPVKQIMNIKGLQLRGGV